MKLSFLPWFGGKFFLVDEILALLPPHRCYVEPFAGGARTLLNKPASPVEVINDKHQHLVNLYRVVRDPATAAELARRLDLTPYSRNEWQDCKARLDQEADIDPVERARMFFVVISQSRNGCEDSAWSTGGPKYSGNVAREFRNATERIQQVTTRLRDVQIECDDALEIIRKWDHADTLFYLDPPYPLATRVGRTRYRHEMTEEEHRALVEVCLKIKGKVLLSGYANSIYADLERAGWQRRDYQTQAQSASGRKKHERARVESLWISPNARQATLFDFLPQNSLS